MNRTKNSTKAITMGKLLLASLCDCAQGNTDQFKRYFTSPTFIMPTGHVELKTVRKRPDGHLELVTWDASLVLTEVKSVRMEAPIGPVPTTEVIQTDA